MIVLDANILIRACSAPKSCSCCAIMPISSTFEPPSQHSRKPVNTCQRFLREVTLPFLPPVETLDLVEGIVRTVEAETYSPYEVVARERIDRRDEDDWPILAPALALRCPIWTEDTDFFGCGVATWTTDRIELYLSEVSARGE